MDLFFNELIGFFDQIWLFIVGGLGALWLTVKALFGRFGLAILSGLGRGAGTGLGSKLTGGAGGQLGSRRMPTNPTPRHARQALWQAEARQQRMQSYIDTWFDLLAVRGGPYALSIYLYSRLHSGFESKVERLKTRFREFDRLEERAQAIIQRYEAQYGETCEPVRDQLRHLYIRLATWKARHRRFAWRFWKQRWRHYKKRQIATRRAIIAARLKLSRREWRLNTAYRTTLEPALIAVDQYERTYLTHWVHSFEADLESFRLTVISGRLIDILISEKNRPHLRPLGLSDLPASVDALEHAIRNGLDNWGVGYGPQASLETLLEMYLRAWLIRDPELRERWGVNEVWLRQHLPPPGALGVVQQRYGSPASPPARSRQSIAALKRLNSPAMNE